MTHLFSPTRVGPYGLDHRVVMAPLTRMRASVGDVPNDLIAEYYSQRATAGGLIVSEGTPVAPEGYGYARAPGMFTDAQRDGWRKITGAVHAKEGRIFAQLWHVGRQSNPVLQPNGEDPIAPSASQAPGMGIASSGPVPFAPARALRLEEIAPIVAQFGHAAKLAKEAGFDGVEIHGANGYLPDQFLQDGTNQRTDRYGGSLENRARFMLEVTEAAADVFGAERVGMRLTPSGMYGGMSDSDPLATFSYVTRRLTAYGLAYLHIVEPRTEGALNVSAAGEAVSARHLRPLFDGPIIASGGFTGETGEAMLRSGDADLIAFGRRFISNPDLVERLRRNLPLNAYDRTTFYGGDARGYTDYPAWNGAGDIMSAA